MSLSPGDRVGPYEVVAAIGAGGMGEVYRAHDAKLNRDVAIKILPDLFAADPDRRARFDREAQTLAALNHPNIAHIHGVEGTALVMEFVDGEDLAQRISRGAVPLDEALSIARQIADALQAAHDRGVVHRDLKPANVKVRPDGTVKVLDFGLAKLGVQESPGAVATSPTFTSPAMMTHAGVIIGTAAYMAPEQAKGKPVDRRADLWALGVVLFEMLTGRSPFDGETITDVLAAVVTRDPDWGALPAQTPAGVRRLLTRCLQRDPRRRLADAGEAAYQIDEATTAAPEAAPAAIQRAPTAPAARAAARRGIAVVVPWVIVGILLAAGIPLWRESRTTPLEVLRYSVEAPPKTTFNLVSRPALAISRDGRMVAFLGTTGGQTHLYVRRQTEFESHIVPGTEGASEPVFSPDGRWLAFYASNKLNKVSVEGGPVEPLADVNDPRGLSWDSDEAITFTPQSTGAVFEVSPGHPGDPRPITTLKDKQERTHRWAQRLPNGALIFTVGNLSSPDNYDGATIDGLLKTGERREIVKGAAMARYVPPGYLLFARGSSLFAAAFDAETLEVRGTPAAVAQGVAIDGTTGATNFAYALAGTLAYIGGSGDSLHRLTWVDRTGRTQPLDLAPAMYLDVKLSPDARRVAVVVVAGGGADVWVYDFARATFTRLTFGGSHRTPVWSADGTTVYYIALAPDGSSNQVMKRPADGSREEEVVVTLKQNVFLRDVTPDGHTALGEYSTNLQKADIATVALEKGAELVPLVATRFDEYCVTLSPDRRWVAYQSDETSRYEVYVRDASGKGGRWQISTAGGEEPHWSPDGRELYYRADAQMMAVRLEPGATFQNSAPRLLFEGLYNLRSESGISFDVDPNKADRFLMVRLADDNAAAGALRVVVNWTAELKQLMAGPR